jgi:ABC-type transport system involved in multi-copper enzyme maturation permease subunit
MLGSLNFFNDDRIVRYLKDACLLLIWLSSLVIAITTTARQIPAERESRTIYPLLAKPVGRGEFVVGKFLGCWLASGICCWLLFFFAVLAASREHTFPLSWLISKLLAALDVPGHHRRFGVVRLGRLHGPFIQRHDLLLSSCWGSCSPADI